MSTPAPLPPVPEGADPYVFYGTLAHDIYYPPHPRGLLPRIILLLAITSYVILTASVFLCLTLIDYRRRQLRLWLWKMVTRSRGRYIVGNQQLLRPLLSLICAVIFAAHLANDYNVFLHDGSQKWTSALRLAPWTTLFVLNWVVSWASLQSFILANGECNKQIAWITPRLANYTFMLVGVAQALALIAFDVFAGREGAKSWSSYNQLKDFYASNATTRTGGALNEAALQVAEADFAVFFSFMQCNVNVTLWVLSNLMGTCILTTIVNAGALFLVTIVRRQIKMSLNNNFRTSFSLSTYVVRPSSPSWDSDPTARLPLPPAGGDAGPSAPCSAHSFPADHKAVPTRADVREMAAGNSGLIAEHAKNLMLLHRAELDLIVTGLSTLVLTLSVAVLCAWSIVRLRQFSSMAFCDLEVILFGGTYVYGIVSTVALTIHCYISWTYMSTRSNNLQIATLSEAPLAGPQSQKEPQNSFDSVLRRGPIPDEPSSSRRMLERGGNGRRRDVMSG